MKKTLVMLVCMTLILAMAACAATNANTPAEQETDKTPEPAGNEISNGNTAAVVSENGGADLPDGTLVEVKPQCFPAYGVSFRLPPDWTYEVIQTDDDPTSNVTVHIRPEFPGSYGEITFYCSSGAFGVCGTGLEQKEIEFNGHEAWQGFYDGSKLWSFICLKDCNGCAVINSAVNWYGDYEDVIDKTLSTVEFVFYGPEDSH